MSELTSAFSPSVPKRTYTDAQWKEKEDWYVDKILNLSMPNVPSSADIRAFAVEMEELLTIARIDYGYVKQNYEEYEIALKNQERVLFYELKKNPLPEMMSLKLTVDEMKGAVANHISQQEWKKTGLNLYDIVMTVSKRYIFIENYVRNLSEKRENIITHMTLNKQDLYGAGPGTTGV